MSNERPDEFLSWRTKLTQPDALPEQGLDDPETAWQQLYARLGEKPRRRLFYWYGAAACLLLALIPAALLFHDRPSPSDHRHPSELAARPTSTLRQASAIRPESSPRPVSPPRLAGPAITRSTTTPSSSGASRISRVLTRLLPSKSGARLTVIGNDPHAWQALLRSAASSRVFSPPAGPTSITLAPPSGQGLQLAQQPPKRILRVVSINELDTPPAMGPALTLERSSASFRIHIYLDKDLLRQVSANRGADPEFLKLKIPLQNP